ncbi:MAG: VPLPA-CTERM sorting domain-containing protein [Pseudomonadota bacterium]
MKVKLKTLVAAVALCAAGGAQAAISEDGMNGGNGIATGTGQGELFVNVWDPVRAKSLILDLNLTVNDFRNNNAALINTFNVTDALTQSFIAGSPNQANMKWSVVGVSNGPGTSALGFVTTHGAGTNLGVPDAGTSIFANIQNANPPSEAPYSGTSVQVGMEGISNYVNNNNFALGASGTSVISDDTFATGFMGGAMAHTVAGSLNFSNVGGLSDQMLMSFIYMNDANGDPLGETPVLVQAFADGFWKLNATTGNVAYVSAVPIPPALWLLGSSLAGLVAVARRRKETPELALVS